MAQTRPQLVSPRQVQTLVYDFQIQGKQVAGISVIGLQHVSSRRSAFLIREIES